MIKRFLLLSMLLASMVTLGRAQYCLPTYNNACTSDDYIDQFLFGGINNNGTGCGSPGPSNYSNYTGMTAVVNQSTAYAVTCRPGPTWGQYFVMCIDFNQDLDFDDPNEFFDIGYSLGGGMVTNTINIPGVIPSGITRLRVMCRYANTPLTQADVCATGLSFGEVEEYSINILPPPPHDAAVLSVDAPVDGCSAGFENVKASFANLGTTIIDTLTMCYSLDGSGWVCETLNSLGLAYGATYQHTFATPANVSTLGLHSFDVSVAIYGDANASNNLITNYTMNNIPLVSSLPYFEDFESNNGGWLPAGSNSSWEYGTPSEFASVPEINGCGNTNLSWCTGISTNYNDYEISYLESPCFDFSSLTTDPFLRFSHLFRMEDCCETYSVEVSTNAGVSWSTLGTSGTGVNWYNGATYWHGYSSTNVGEWTDVMHVLNGTAGFSDVKIRFAFSSNSNTTDEGILVDNIQISNSIVDPQGSIVTQPLSGCGLNGTEVVAGTFFNAGSDTIFSLNVCFNVDGGTAICETINDTIAPFGTYNYTFTSTANLSALGAHTIAIWSNQITDLDHCNDTAYKAVVNFMNITSYPYVEDFETGTNSWAIVDMANSTWAFGTPAKNTITGAASGINAFTTGGLGLTDYNNDENSYVQGPCFDFTTLPVNPWIGMSVWWNAEFSWDGAVLQTSTDNGVSWQNIGNFGDPNNWYTDNTIDGNPGGQQEGWSGRFATTNNGSNGWVWAKHPISPSLVGQSSVLMRIAFGSDASVVDDGFAFDNFTIGGAPDFSLGNDTIGCGSFLLDPQLGSGLYQWAVQDTSSATWTILPITTPTIQFVNNGMQDSTINVALTYTNSIGFSGTDTIMISIPPIPVVNLGPDVTVCSDSIVTLAVVSSPNLSYLWSTGNTTNTIAASIPGTYFVTVTGNFGNCAASDTIFIGHYTPIVATIGPSTTNYCIGDQVNLTTTFAPYILWSTGDTTISSIVTAGGTYSVELTSINGCESTDSITLVFNTLPSINLGADPTICINGSVTLDAGSGLSYLWSDLSTNQTLMLQGTVLGLGTTTYSVVVTDGNSCENTDSVLITVIGCSGIPQEMSGYEIMVYPNPSDGLVTIDISGSDLNEMNLNIFDLNGQVVYNSRFTINGVLIKQLDLSHLSAGVYYLQFNLKNERNIQKLIIK